MITSLDQIDWNEWIPTERATLLFIVKKGNVLLIRKKRGLGAGKINGPGGHIEPGETPMNAAIREVVEELGVTPCGTITHNGELEFHGPEFDIEVHVFVATDFTGMAEETDEAIPIWMYIEDIPYDQMWEDDKYWLPAVLEGLTVRGKFVFDTDQHLLDHVAEVI